MKFFQAVRIPSGRPWRRFFPVVVFMPGVPLPSACTEPVRPLCRWPGFCRRQTGLPNPTSKPQWVALRRKTALTCHHGKMTASWDDRIDSFWSAADDTQPEAMLRDMEALVAERPDGDPDALYEWASIHDFLGREDATVPLYRAALARGLQGPRRPQAIIQLASSLRNIGDPGAAVELLREQPGDAVTGDAAQAFLALALRDCGRHDEALKVALGALAPTLPLYGRSVSAYAQKLVHRPSPGVDAR